MSTPTFLDLPRLTLVWPDGHNMAFDVVCPGEGRVVFSSKLKLAAKHYALLVESVNGRFTTAFKDDAAFQAHFKKCTTKNAIKANQALIDIRNAFQSYFDALPPAKPGSHDPATALLGTPVHLTTLDGDRLHFTLAYRNRDFVLYHAAHAFHDGQNMPLQLAYSFVDGTAVVILDPNAAKEIEFRNSPRAWGQFKVEIEAVAQDIAWSFQELLKPPPVERAPKTSTPHVPFATWI